MGFLCKGASTGVCASRKDSRTCCRELRKDDACGVNSSGDSFSLVLGCKGNTEKRFSAGRAATVVLVFGGVVLVVWGLSLGIASKGPPQ